MNHSMCVTHQVGAKPIINWLHRLAWIIGKDGPVMITCFKWWACDKRPGGNWTFTKAIISISKKSGLNSRRRKLDFKHNPSNTVFNSD